MKVVFGYFIQIICILLFLLLGINFIGTLLYKEHHQESTSFLIGYYFGLLVISLLCYWLVYKLFKFGKKLIKSTKTNKEISEIGNQ